MSILRSQTDLELDGHFIAVGEMFGFADAVFDGHQVGAIFREQGCVPAGFADAGVHRDDAPAVGSDAGDGFEGAALLRRNGDEEVGAQVRAR